MAHIFFIDPVEKLNIKKDSSLLMAIELQKQDKEVFLLFEKDFFVSNQVDEIDLYAFRGQLQKDGFYIDEFKLGIKKTRSLTESDVIHMRIDPPYDSRYQRYLWMLKFLQDTMKLTVLNDPVGIMKYNEKLSAFSLENNIPSYVGSSLDGLHSFVKTQKTKQFILKPLDLYSGIGVEKVELSQLDEKFEQKCKDYGGAVIAQPFIEQVTKGEYRSLYFDGDELGTIIKIPKEGEFLTNIAQGASYHKVDLPKHLKKECDDLSKKMLKDGLRFLAFDLLGDAITEVNVTCPGLVVEVSQAHNVSITQKIIKKLMSTELQ